MKNISEKAFILPALVFLLSSCASSRALDHSPAIEQSTPSVGVAPKAAIPSDAIQVSVAQKYEALAKDQQLISDRIDQLSESLVGAKRSQSKKITKEIAALNMQLGVVERKMDAFPLSVKNPQGVSFAAQDDAFRNELQKKAQDKIAGMDLDTQAKGDVDPELRRAYENYSEEGAKSKTQVVENGVIFSVQIGTGRSDKASAFYGAGEVSESDYNGTSIYYTGSYSTYEQAKNACSRIRSSTRYGDAFVIAFSNGKKISVKQAEQLIAH